jgi:hypothetical protein
MVKGALIGGLLGGVGGAAGVFGAGGAAGGAMSAGEALTNAPVNLASTNLITGATEGLGAAGAASAAVPAAVAPAAAGGGGGGMFSGLLGNGGLGSLLTGLGGGLSNAGEAKAQRQAEEDKRKQIAKNYAVGNFLSQSLLSPYAQPGYSKAPELDPYQGTGAWEYDPVAGRLVRKQQTVVGQGG